jgi:soluble lytic murein transglycosylase-like protein
MQEINKLIDENAKLFDLDTNLLLAIIKIESNFDAKAMRYEKKYRYLVNPQRFAIRFNITTETETELQKFSYGLMQIMGAVAREHEFPLRLTDLLDPINNLMYGCMHLAKFKKKYEQMTDYVSAYNQGSPRKDKQGLYINQNYVTKVMNEYQKYQKGSYLS